MQSRSYILILLFIIFLFSPYQTDAQEVSPDHEANMICFKAMSNQSLTTEEFEKVWPICIKAAESGAAGAQNLLGVVYLGQQREKAIYWFTRAAENGHSGAKEQLEHMGIIE